MRYINYVITRLWPAALLVVMFSFEADAQRRDFLTQNEIEIIRNTQDIDERILVLTRMADRRLHVLGINVNGWKDAGKASEVWGEMPKGTRADLLSDIRRILQKAVDDIDNLAANPSAAPIRDKGDKKAKKDPERLGIALRELAAAAARYQGPLKDQLDLAENNAERGAISGSLQLCDEITEAAARLRSESKKPGS